MHRTVGGGFFFFLYFGCIILLCDSVREKKKNKRNNNNNAIVFLEKRKFFFSQNIFLLRNTYPLGGKFMLRPGRYVLRRVIFVRSLCFLFKRAWNYRRRAMRYLYNGRTCIKQIILCANYIISIEIIIFYCRP